MKIEDVNSSSSIFRTDKLKAYKTETLIMPTF